MPFKSCLVLFSLVSVIVFGDITPQCHMTAAYPPDPSRILPEYVINLDDSPSTRWNIPIEQYKQGIAKMLGLFFKSKIIQDLAAIIELDSKIILARMPKDYAKEIESIASIVNVTVAEVIIYNMAYEVFGLCTSIVAQDTTGHIYHGRNLDFGLWPAINWTDFQWDLTDDLRPILFKANFTQNGNVLYRSVVFAGYIGLLTGVREKAMTISIDSRFDDNYDKYLIDWIEHPEDKSVFTSFMTRQAIETYDNFDDAVNFMGNSSTIGPSYVIIGGYNKNEGAVLTFGPNMTLYDKWLIPDALPVNNSAQEPFYVLETNYDHWTPAPFYDDRRGPGEACMNEIGSKGIDFYTLYNVLNGLPNRNRLITYTALMDSATGTLQSYYQYCDIPECFPPW